MKWPSKKGLGVGLITTITAGVAVVVGLRKAGVGVAATPKELSARSWKKALIETKNAIGKRNLGMLAAAIAYGGALAFFPFVVATVAITSIVLVPDQIRDIVDGLDAYLPQDIASLLSAQLTNALDSQSANVAVAVVAIGIALFGVSSAMNSLVNALNIAYDVEETRHIVKVRLVSLVLAVCTVIGLLLVIPLIVLGEGMLRDWGVPEAIVALFSVLRWIILAVIMACGLSVVYRYAPNRANAKWQWVSWGAVMATLLWLAVTALFFVYVQNFASFSQSYSLFAGIIVLMMWLNFTGLIILVGAAVNHQLERRTIVRTNTK